MKRILQTFLIYFERLYAVHVILTNFSLNEKKHPWSSLFLQVSDTRNHDKLKCLQGETA